MFRYLHPDKPPPLPPKDDEYRRTAMTTTNKLSIGSLLNRRPAVDKPDEGISLPWNFQHHIHVDEGYVGLPPSWLTSTFSEEEIAQIQTRRAAVVHGMRPPSPTTSLYPSVVQGHRRNQSSSSTPNLTRPVSPAPTNVSSTVQQQPTTPASATFSLAPRNILSDLGSAVKSSAGKIFRVKRSPPQKTHSRLSDETFFAPELMSPGSVVSPKTAVVPVWELYNTTKPDTSTATTTLRPSTSASSIRSRTPSLSNNQPVLSRSVSRSKSQSSLSSAASTHHSPSSTPPIPSLPLPSTSHPHRPPHLAPSHSQAGSLSSLVSIPEASPAPGAVVPAQFLRQKGSLKRKAVPVLTPSPPRQHHPTPSTSHLRSQSHAHQNQLVNPNSHSYSNSVPLLPSQANQQTAHKHTASTSSQNSNASTSSAKSASSQHPPSASSSSSSLITPHKETPVPVLSLSLPRMSLSLPFGEGTLSFIEDRLPESSQSSGPRSIPASSSYSQGPPPLPPKSQSTFPFPSSTPTNLSSIPALPSTTTISPARRRHLPSSKPYPGYPVPALPSASAGRSNGAPSASSKEPETTKLIPVPPTPFSPFLPPPANVNGGMRHPPSPLPVIPLSLVPGVVNAPPPPSVAPQQPLTATSLLSPPSDSAVFTPTGLLSPTSPSGMSMTASSFQSPNSAQLWSEIAQMMDPGMLSAIPGLHLSTALPEDLRDAVRRAGEQGSEATAAAPEATTTSAAATGVMLVGDLVGTSPAGSSEGGEDESQVAEKEQAKEEEEEDSDDDDDDDDDDVEEAYDGVVQSASVVVARSPLPPQSQPIVLPALPRVIEPLRTVGRPRLLNVNGNGLGGVEQTRGKSKETIESDHVSTRDSIRNSTATIVPLSVGVNGHGQSQRQLHRPPSIKLVLSNGIAHAVNGDGVESTTPVGTAMSEGEGGNGTAFLSYYLDGENTPSPLPSPGSALGSPLRDEVTPTSAFYPDSLRYPGQRRLSRMKVGEEDDEDDFYVEEGEGPSRSIPLAATPTIVLNDGVHPPAKDDDKPAATVPAPLNGPSTIISNSTSSSASDLTDGSLSPAPSPFQQRYRGWVSTLVTPLSEFIDEAVDPRDHYLDLTEIAEGESGSVYAAKVNKANVRKLRLGEVVRMQDFDDLGLKYDGDDDVAAGEVEEDKEEKTKLVAIKSIALVPSGTPKLVDLQRELGLMKGLWHSHVLSVDAVYVDLVDDSVWLRMELMERSLADVIILVENGLVLQERTIARFASDILLALEFLERHDIAHRDVRSDNMLINNQGVLKLADFSNAVRVDPIRPLYTDVVGVPYWQAPELLAHDSTTTTTTTARTVPAYDPLKLDVWSLGSTVWEMAETYPPFYHSHKFEDQWPPLNQPGLYSPAFHDFLRRCSEPAEVRPCAADLIKAPFINNACGRPVIIQLVAQCRTIEWTLRERNDDDS